MSGYSRGSNVSFVMSNKYLRGGSGEVRRHYSLQKYHVRSNGLTTPLLSVSYSAMSWAVPHGNRSQKIYFRLWTMGLKDRSGGEAKFAVDAQQVNHVHGTFTRGHVDWMNEIFPPHARKRKSGEGDLSCSEVWHCC